MEILNKIDTFAVDIYFKLPSEIGKDYIEICQSIADILDNNFSNNKTLMEQKNELLSYLLGIMETNDYIKMADALSYNVRPIIKDVYVLISSSGSN